MTNFENQLYKFGIVPVIKVDDVSDAKPLAQALCEGGLPVAEVTFRTDCAKEVIKIMSDSFPQMLVGAGTVLTTQQVDDALEAGAQFIVSPGLNEKVVRYCQEKGVPILPGCATPSEMEKAIELGLETVKFFPAEANGGLNSIKAMSAPYSGLKFMPTGGINLNNMNDYLAFDKIIACGGTWMVNDDLIKNKKWDDITLLTKQTVQAMLDIQLHHVGMGVSDDKGEQLAELMNRPTITNLPNSRFVSGIEFMYDINAGTLHHLCLSTKNIERAMFVLENLGYSFDCDTIRLNSKGKIEFIYFDQLISGCKCHLRLEV